MVSQFCRKPHRQAAWRCFRRSGAFFPDRLRERHGEIPQSEGVRLYKQEQYDQSMSTLNKALHEDQFDAGEQCVCGADSLSCREYQQAEYHFRVALNADPSSEEAKDGLTMTLIKQGHPDQALDALERSASMAEKVQDPRWLKSNFYKVTRYKKQVEEHLFLGKVADRVRIAYAYEKLGDYDNAMVYYNKALEISPDDPNILMTIGEMYEKSGGTRAARRRSGFKRVYRIDPATVGITDALTRNNIAISDIIGPK